jgi:hypothetical protein
MRRNAWKCWVITGVAVTAGYFAVPGATGRDIVYLAIGLGSVAAILIGTVLHRPQDRLSWYLLALGAL